MRRALIPILLALGAGQDIISPSTGPTGTEFQVSDYAPASQVYPRVVMDASGRFMVVWEDWRNGVGNGTDIFARLFSSDGAPLGADFQVNTYSAGNQLRPTLHADSKGDFLIVWFGVGQNASGVFGRRYDRDANPLGDEFQVNSVTTDFHPSWSSIAVDRAGNFIVVWENLEQDGSGGGVFGRRFVSDGTPLGADFQVNTYSTGFQGRPAVAADPEGNFLVVWESDEQDGDDEGVFARRFSSDGTPLGPEWQVNTFTTSYQRNPAVAADSNGNFIVAWTSHREDGFDAGVFGRRFAADGYPLGAEFQLNAFTLHDQLRPSVSVDASGDFVALWTSAYRDGSGDGVVGRRFGSDGTPLGGEFLVNQFSGGTQESPSVASDASGNFVVVWHSYVGYYSPYGVFGRRFQCAEPHSDPACDGDDLRLEAPRGGWSVDCNPSPYWPTFKWYPGAYDSFRVEVSPEPKFPKKRLVTSGDRFLEQATWTPTTGQWSAACRNAYRARPYSPKMYIRVLGVDHDLPKKNKSRKVHGPSIKVSVESF